MEGATKYALTFDNLDDQTECRGCGPPPKQAPPLPADA
jgi:hypothetical protein